MQSESILKYIWLGLGWRFVQDVQAGYKVHGQGFVLDNLNNVLLALDKFGLVVTARAAAGLRSIQDGLARLSQDAVLDEVMATQIRGTMTALQQTLGAEAEGLLVNIVTDKRLDVRKLVNQPSSLLAPGVFAKMAEIAQHDVTESAKCIAFERSTAGAFHILRATEAVLRSYYMHVVKRGRLKMPMWGAIIDALKKRTRTVPPELVQNLDNIRASFRNPTQHPEKEYDVQEVQDLFSLCVDVINRMIRAQT